jgi:hypothetical protein
MSDPAREEQRRGCTSQIVGLEGLGAGMKEVADVVERHDDHYESTQGIDGTYARLRMGA